MKLSERINAFATLGESLHDLPVNELNALLSRARNENAWFTEESVSMAIKGIAAMLERNSLTAWAESYPAHAAEPRIVGVAMAGNIPLVGFHDLLCVLISGHSLKARLSSQDSVLMRYVAQMLINADPRFANRIVFSEQLKDTGIMIATGSDNTARYFEFYFRNIPHIIRKNRASCAVIAGEESKEEFELLGRDIFSYYGLGCRNVSKLYVPDDFDFRPLIESWTSFESVLHHHKYANNYDYQKAILLVNQEPFLDSGFAIIRESESLVSPISTIYFEKYSSREEALEKISAHSDKLQVTASARGWLKNSVPFGQTQNPTVSDYADHVDTMKFLGVIA